MSIPIQEPRQLPLDAFKGRPPPKFGNWFRERTDVTPRTTDFDKQVVPRAIYNDPIEELLLREEGASGRKRKNNDVLNPLRKVGGLQAVAGARDPTTNEENSKITYSEESESTHTVILTDWGIDILSFTFVEPIRPIPKPRIACPTTDPVYNPTKHKALPPSFPSTYRITTGMNMLAVTPVPVARKAYESVEGMVQGRKGELEEGMLRYMKKVPKKKVVKPKVEVAKMRSVTDGVESVLPPPMNVVESPLPIYTEVVVETTEVVPTATPVVIETLKKEPSEPRIDRSSEMIAAEPVGRESLPRPLSVEAKTGIAASTVSLSPEEREELEEETRRLYAAWGRSPIQEEPEEHKTDLVDSTASVWRNEAVPVGVGVAVELPITTKEAATPEMASQHSLTEGHAEVVMSISTDVSLSGSPSTPSPNEVKARRASAAALATAAAQSAVARRERLGLPSASTPVLPTAETGGSTLSLSSSRSEMLNNVPVAGTAEVYKGEHPEEVQVQVARRLSTRSVSVVIPVKARQEVGSPEKSSVQIAQSTTSLHAPIEVTTAPLSSPSKSLTTLTESASTLPPSSTIPPTAARFLNAMDYNRLHHHISLPPPSANASTATEAVISTNALIAEYEEPASALHSEAEPESPEIERRFREKKKSKGKLHMKSWDALSSGSLGNLFGKKDKKEKEREKEKEKEKEREKEKEKEKERGKERERKEAEALALEKERERERLEAEREREKQLEKERLEKEVLEKERAEREALEHQERIRIETERLQKEHEAQRERDRLEHERLLEQQRLHQLELDRQREAEREAERERERQALLAHEAERERHRIAELARLEQERLDREAALAAKIAQEAAEMEREKARIKAIEDERERERQEREREEVEKREREEREREVERVRVEEERRRKEVEERQREEREREERERIQREEEERERVRREEEERERLRKEAEEKERVRREAEEKERLRVEAEEKERIRKEVEEKERLRKEAEEKERLRKEAEEKERLRKHAEEQDRLRVEAEEKERQRRASEAAVSAAISSGRSSVDSKSMKEEAGAPTLVRRVSKAAGPGAPASLLGKETSDDVLAKSMTATWKNAKLELKVIDFELHCTEVGKNKPYKHFFPLELRRVVSATSKSDDVTLYACITRKGDKGGSKFKKITMQVHEGGRAKVWGEAMMDIVYGGTYAQVVAKEIVVLVDKHDGKEHMKLVEKYMKPVWEAAGKSFDIKLVQYNEFSIMNALSAYDWKKLAHIVLTNPEFTPRVQQLLVRNQKTQNPVLLPCEADPVDAALAILRANIGKSKKDAFHVTGFVPKREEGKIAGMFKAFK
ncbi:hypothetical protein HK097_010983 [Rhizophlyctis rosea]|uniref:Uncharacterized protein n=1 Tax=Rhizophlyctis rosea TaxID=64517 RepID=A0AAD5X267_9FUNG|nr:hypothetical protein HK097_010983 [Rhizophlyctis rosea]